MTIRTRPSGWSVQCSERICYCEIDWQHHYLLVKKLTRSPKPIGTLLLLQLPIGKDVGMNPLHSKFHWLGGELIPVCCKKKESQSNKCSCKVGGLFWSPLSQSSNSTTLPLNKKEKKKRKKGKKRGKTKFCYLPPDTIPKLRIPFR